ncbi:MULTISPECIES: hypothetical protein [Amycolatopsis]|uniref:Uncharacterized protein n=1 Tax=Amycolatopsis albidoflavus TaxID=102226 RepID=A0ABW5I7V7_9PSEU
MSEPVQTATADLYVDYGHFSVTDYAADVPELGAAYANGLVGVDSGGVAEEGFLLVHNMMDGPPQELDEIAYVGPGTYRVRVHARGRDIAPHSRADTPNEHYLISVWPAPETSPTVHKQTDRFGHEVRAREAKR